MTSAVCQTKWLDEVLLAKRQEEAGFNYDLRVRRANPILTNSGSVSPGSNPGPAASQKGTICRQNRGKVQTLVRTKRPFDSYPLSHDVLRLRQRR